MPQWRIAQILTANPLFGDDVPYIQPVGKVKKVQTLGDSYRKSHESFHLSYIN
jgi:hypothetical protein